MTENVAEMEIIEQVQEDTNDDVVYKEIKDPYGFIYITTNLINGKRYLGKRTFTSDWKYYFGSGTLFKKALKLYKKHNFTRDIILICYSEDELNNAEYELSVYLDVVQSPDWYNLEYGGRGGGSGRIITPEMRQKMSEAHKGEKNHFYGKHHTEEAIKKISEASKNRTLSDETRKKISEAVRGKNHPLYGTSPSESTRKKISEGNKGKHSGEKSHWYGVRKYGPDNPNYGNHLTDEAKRAIGVAHSGINSKIAVRVYCIELDEIFISAKAAGEKCNSIGTSIIKCCRGKLHSSGTHPITKEKLHWKYVFDQQCDDGTIIQGAITLGYITEERVNNYLKELKTRKE